MTMSEYEERFRPPAPSLHQTFAEVRGPNRGGSRSRRLWVSAALGRYGGINEDFVLVDGGSKGKANGVQEPVKGGVEALV